ncbi:hypothetical protein ABTK18_19360, partial [Acinetobacter baumannii]
MSDTDGHGANVHTSVHISHGCDKQRLLRDSLGHLHLSNCQLLLKPVLEECSATRAAKAFAPTTSKPRLDDLSSSP